MPQLQENRLKKAGLSLSDADKLAISQAVFGEAAGEPTDVQKMVIQTVLNRLRSGRKKEFGGNVNDILKRGYYAVSNPNDPYKQAMSGVFPDVNSKAKFGRVKKLLDAVLADQDYGQGHFYFTPEEEKKLRLKNIQRQAAKRPPAFNFSAVKPFGQVGKYNVYGYAK